MNKRLFMIGSLIMSLAYSSLPASIRIPEEDRVTDIKHTSSLASKNQNHEIDLDADVDTADILFSSSQENAGNRAFNIYVRYYQISPEVCGFFDELDPQIFLNLIKGEIEEARKYFLAAREKKLSKS